ncbi:hypothetical protein GTY20_21000 [Streptomyces sp. SID4946]|uniref:collagenase n=1 Tax=Streptomyces sp. LamerLS-31b TaxID=1839765 RepID=UPI00081DD541|nr:hypothetical protein [Streptomyces sp. SID4946]SCF83145.1 microbial collagenase [Streptomyces sp. DconLS]SCF92582.1 microbial collagenase [Streptomyces sp. LamerLS-31b]
MLHIAVRPLDALFAGSHANDVSAGQADCLDVYSRYLNAYDSGTWDAVPEMDRALNAIYTPLWRGPSLPDFVTAITADPGVTDTLHDFTLDHRDLLGGDNDVLDSNAGNDLANFIRVPALHSKIRPLIKGLMDGSSITGPTANLWVHLAYRADTGDPGQCSHYGVCDLAKQLTAAALPISYSWSNFTIMAQALTATGQTDVCASLTHETTFYQNQVKTAVPIPGGYFDLKMVIFGSKTDCATSRTCPR